MSKNFAKARSIVRRFTTYRLETGFSMLEAVVVVGVLLALAVGGFFAYGPIAENAKMAKVQASASEVHTGVLVASMDGDPATNPQDVIDTWNLSTTKIHVEILEPVAGVAAMTTAEPKGGANGDFCVQATNVASPHIKARRGACSDVTSDPDIDGDGIPNSTDPDIDGDGIPNESDPDIDGDGTPNATDTAPGGSDPLNEDIDGDGIPNGSDSDVDGDGIPNSTDPDIDGDGTPNETDSEPNGLILGPQYFDATGGSADTDPRVKIIDGKMTGSKAEVFLAIDNAGLPTNTGPYYGISTRVTCQLPDGSQYYKFGYMWTQYTGATPSSVTVQLPCPTTDGSIAVGYIAGAYNAAPELTEPTSGIKGPINVITEGLLAPLGGNMFGAPTVSTYTDPRVSMRNAVMDPAGLKVGVNLNLGGAPFNSNPYFGLSNRLTCKLADGSTFHHYPTLYTSYNGQSYPAFTHTFTCPASASVIGYVAGGDGGAAELTANSGQKGPTNVLRGGQLNLSGNDESLAPTTQNYSDSRITVRKVTLSGGEAASVGLNINSAQVPNGGVYLGYSARLTCENLTTGAKTYKTTSLYFLYTRDYGPVQNFNSSCLAGTKAIGYIVGPYMGTPELTASYSGGGPANVVKGGVQ